jgi:hypothetical protein
LHNERRYELAFQCIPYLERIFLNEKLTFTKDLLVFSLECVLLIKKNIFTKPKQVYYHGLQVLKVAPKLKVYENMIYTNVWKTPSKMRRIGIDLKVR